MSKAKIKTACVETSWSGTQMDRLGSGFDRVHPLPPKCLRCTCPDFDFVANPYLLGKTVASSIEIASAEIGNFLVTERVQQILELVVREACSFHDTADRKSKKPLPWKLAVPRHVLEVPWLEANKPRCSKCAEPKEGFHLKGFPKKALGFVTDEIDIFKTKGWFGGSVEEEFKSVNYWRKKYGDPLLPWSHWGVEPPPHPERWTRRMLERDLYFSVRLEQLFKRAKVKGQMVRSSDFNDIKPSPEDEAWIEEKLKLLGEHGLVDATKPAGKSTAAQNWFKQFLKRNAAKGIKSVDFATVESKRKLKLPQDYKNFISKVGSKSFKNVEDIEETLTTVLPPHKLDFKDYRRGKVADLEGEDAEVDGVMFAEMDNGDCFVFDVSAKGGDYPVFWYRHEENTMETFASNFAECIKSFSQKN